MAALASCTLLSMESPTAHLCEVLKKAIGALGLTQKEVEHRLGLSPGYLSRLFGGQIDLKVDHIAQIARVLDVKPEEIFRLAFPPTQDPPTQKTLRLWEGFGVTSPEPAPPTLSWMEKEIDRIVQRALAKRQSS
jgi:transcriptional regulator with XRE-family HTH domain